MSNDLRARAMDLAGWCLEQRYHQGFSERVAGRVESVLRAAVEAERAPLVEALEHVRARASATTNVSLEECRRQLSLIDRIADEALRARKP